MQIKCPSNGLYSLKNSHKPFVKGFQPPLTAKVRLNIHFLSDPGESFSQKWTHSRSDPRFTSPCMGRIKTISTEQCHYPQIWYCHIWEIQMGERNKYWKDLLIPHLADIKPAPLCQRWTPTTRTTTGQTRKASWSPGWDLFFACCDMCTTTSTRCFTFQYHPHLKVKLCVEGGPCCHAPLLVCLHFWLY